MKSRFFSPLPAEVVALSATALVAGPVPVPARRVRPAAVGRELLL